MKYVQLIDHDNTDVVWLIWTKGHVSAFDKARRRGVPQSFSLAMNFDPSYRPLFNG